MKIAVSLPCILLLAIASAFHFYWGLGGQKGIGVALPQHENGEPIVKFSALGSIAFGLFGLAVMLLIAAAAEMISVPLPPVLLRAAMLLLAIVFLARALSWHRYFGIFKRVRGTRFARYDTWLLSPGALLVALGLFYLSAV